MTKREECAEAINLAVGGAPWSEMTDATKAECLLEVDGMLAVLREPNEAMINAFGWDHPMVKKALWQAGIDAILQEGE